LPPSGAPCALPLWGKVPARAAWRERWLSGLRRWFAKPMCVYYTPRVQIPFSPTRAPCPYCTLPPKGATRTVHCWGPLWGPQRSPGASPWGTPPWAQGGPLTLWAHNNGAPAKCNGPPAKRGPIARCPLRGHGAMCNEPRWDGAKGCAHPFGPCGGKRLCATFCPLAAQKVVRTLLAPAGAKGCAQPFGGPWHMRGPPKGCAQAFGGPWHMRGPPKGCAQGGKMGVPPKRSSKGMPQRSCRP
jgi:hypothetical protein